MFHIYLTFVSLKQAVGLKMYETRTLMKSFGHCVDVSNFSIPLFSTE